MLFCCVVTGVIVFFVCVLWSLFGSLAFEFGDLGGLWTGIVCGCFTADIFLFYGCGNLELSSMVAVPWLGSIVIHALGVCFGVMQINLCHDRTFIRWNHLSISEL